MAKLNIKVYRNLMGANDRWAERTRALLKKHRVFSSCSGFGDVFPEP